VKLTIASAHRYPDLARLWYRGVKTNLLPALARAGAETEVVLFRDTAPGSFPARWFEGAILDTPRDGARDFLEFYDAVLERDVDYVLFLDADVFVLDGGWLTSFLPRFSDPRLAAVSFLRRTSQPGVYALLLHRNAYRRLPPPVLAPSCEDPGDLSPAVNRQPGDRAALALRAAGRLILDVAPEEAGPRTADFHGTTVIRASREVLQPYVGARFDDLIATKPYFAMGAYDNILLGALYRAMFGEPFAAGPDGRHLSGSATPETLRTALARTRPWTALSRLVEYFDRSDLAFARLSARFDICALAPPVLSRADRLRARLWDSARRLLGRPP
jgi:hypothetical protein